MYARPSLGIARKRLVFIWTKTFLGPSHLRQENTRKYANLEGKFICPNKESYGIFPSPNYP